MLCEGILEPELLEMMFVLDRDLQPAMIFIMAGMT